MTPLRAARAGLGAALLACLALPAAAQNLSLSPAVVPLRGQPGQSTRQTLALANGTSKRLAFDLEALDVVVRDGARVFVPAGEVAGSIAATAVFSRRSVVAEPGETQSVDVTLTLPAAAHRAVVILFRGTTKLQGEGKTEVTASIGTLLTFTLSDEYSLAPAELAVRPQTASSTLGFEQPFTNDGREPVVVKGMTAVLDGDGRMVGKVASRPHRLLPGEQTVLRADYAGELPPGSYRAIATFDYEGRAVTRTAAFVVR
jgi:hypothetical protein